MELPSISPMAGLVAWVGLLRVKFFYTRLNQAVELWWWRIGFMTSVIGRHVIASHCQGGTLTDGTGHGGSQLGTGLGDAGTGLGDVPSCRSKLVVHLRRRLPSPII